MTRLEQSPLCPHCRAIRLALAEVGIAFETEELKTGAEDGGQSFAVGGDAPYLTLPDGLLVVGAYAISEHLEALQQSIAGRHEGEAHPRMTSLFPGTLEEKAEVRRLVSWFLHRLDREVTRPLLAFKVRPMQAHGAVHPPPRAEQLRPLHAALRAHLDYIGYLADTRRWLAGDELSFADLAAAAELSTLDYLSEVAWEPHPAAKVWYARIKSRPSFRPLIADRLPQLSPPAHYADLDF